MFQTIVERILNQILGEYVEDFSSENLKIGLWSGQVVIRNVKLKKQIIKLLNLPLKLKYSRLGCLKMSIPWSSLASSKIEVVVEGLELLISEIPENKWQCRNTKIIELRKKQIDQYCQAVVNDFLKKNDKSKKQQDEQGYFSKMVTKIIDNIQVTVRDIHIRYEDEITHNYSFGITLEQLKIYTVNRKDEPQFIDRTKKQYQNQPIRKKLILSNFGFYWNEKSEFFDEARIHDRMIETIARRQSLNKKQLNYLLLMSSDAKLFQREQGKQYVQPEINLLIDFKELKLEITNNQLQQIVTQGERLQKYMKEVKVQNRRKLTQLEMIANRELFLQKFPKYYQKKISPDELKDIEKILEKMEVSNFTDGIKKYMMEKQKEKMISEKKKKSAGWFTGPKQLTEEEKKQIENFLEDNFGQEIAIIKRPQQFEFIRVNFNLERLQIIIGNENKKKAQKQGIRTRLEEIKIAFGLRERGYNLNFTLNDIKVDIFKKSLVHQGNQEVTPLLKKFVNNKSKIENRKYMQLKVCGYPLDKPKIDTQIVASTQELLLIFDPKLIKIATDFANIKISLQNTEAAFQKYGEVKNLAANAAKTTIEKPIQKKSFISIDILVNSINVVLFVDPSQHSKGCWGMNSGKIHIFTDPEALKRTEFRFDQPMEKYCLQLSNLNFGYFESKNIFLEQKHQNMQNMVVDYRGKLIDNLCVDLEIEMFQKNNENVPKIRCFAIMHNLNLFLTEFTYINIQKVADCLALPEEESQIKQKQAEKEKQKSEVMKGAKKIGIVFTQKGKEFPKKFIAVLSGGYIYLYAQKKDTHYTEYYYVRNSVITARTELTPEQKPFSFELVNSVNSVTLGFDKDNIMNDWIDLIKKLDEDDFAIIKDEKEPKDKGTVEIIEKNPNTLNFEVIAEIEKINLAVILPTKKNIKILIERVHSRVRLYEEKILLSVSLKRMALTDNIYKYKAQHLKNFLLSREIQGSDKLIDIHIQQLSPNHPNYQFVNNDIQVNFGKLECYYKPETVEATMLFFLPKDKGEKVQVEKKQTYTKSELKENENEVRRRLALKLFCEIWKKQPQKFNLRVNVRIRQVAVGLVNRKNKVFFGEAHVKDLRIKFSQSNRRMILTGGLSEMCYADYSCFPFTIYQEQSQYTEKDYFVKAINSEKQMITFDIQLLQFPNNQGKKMIIDTSIRDLEVSYIQQPVLRILAFLLQQMLPSLTPTGDSGPKKIPNNSEKPELSPMQLRVDLQNIRVMIEPRTGTHEYVRLNVEKIFVKNNSFYRDFFQDLKGIPEQERVLVQNYDIRMKNINISANHSKSIIKLTNDLDFDVSCDLIQNSPYYQKRYGKNYLPGMRINCAMNPFLMKINHDDYNFLMKCLYWNITYDDNAEGYMFDGVSPEKKKQSPPEPIYMSIKMDKISLCVTENEFPLCVLVQDQMDFGFCMNQEGMNIKLQIQNMVGTNLKKVEGQDHRTVERGLFNSFGYEKFYDTKDLYQLDKLVHYFHHNSILLKHNQIPVISVELEMSKNGNLAMKLGIEQLRISVDLKNLLILSKLALMEEYIHPPKSKIVPLKQPAPPSESGDMSIVLSLNNFMASVSDKTAKNYMVMEGSTLAKILMKKPLPEEEVLKRAKTSKMSGVTISDHGVQLNDFTIYFCNILDQKNKRVILQPLSLKLYFKQLYEKIEKSVFLRSDVDGELDSLIFEASIKDILKINNIAQDNLAVLTAETQVKQVQCENDAQKVDKLQKIEKVDTSNIKKQLQKKVDKKILPKMRASLQIKPIQLLIINDCNNNFMPVLQFVIQESTVIFDSNPLKSHLFYNLCFKLNFFNPKASKYEPIIEKYQVGLNFLIIKTQYGNKIQIILESSQNPDMKELRLNLSTQFISSLTATFQIAKQQSKKIKSEKKIEQFEVSPFIIENMTNSSIMIIRDVQNAENEIKIPSRFSGPIKLADNYEDNHKIRFILGNKKLSMGLEHNGLVSIPGQKNYYVEFKVEKLNRIIRFIGQRVLMNCTTSKLYCAIYNRQNKRLGEESIEIEAGKMIPVFMLGSFELTFNNNTFTERVMVEKIPQVCTIVSKSKKFQISLSRKRRMNRQQIIEIKAPLIINNCLPKSISIQFIRQGKTLKTKDIPSQTSYEVFANEDIFYLFFKIKAEGYYWSRQFAPRKDYLGKQEEVFLADRIDGGSNLKYRFDQTKQANQYTLNVFCPAFIISELDYDTVVYGNLERDEKYQKPDHYYPLGGQNQLVNKRVEKVDDFDRTVLVGAETGSKIRICGKGCLIDFSEPVNLGGLGIHHSRIVVKKQIKGREVSVFTLVGVETSLKKMIPNSNIFIKKITIRSRSILQNFSKFNLLIKEEGGKQFLFEIKKGGKKPFHFTMPELKQKPQRLLFKSEETEESIPILSNVVGTIYFRLKQKNAQTYHYFKLDIEQIKKYMFFAVRSVDERDLPYEILVKSSKLEVEVPLFLSRITKNDPPINFINELPHEPFRVRIGVRAIGMVHTSEVEVEVDDLNFRQKLSFFEEGITQQFILAQVYVIFNDNKRFVVIDEVATSEEQIKEYPTQVVNAKFDKISLSLIQNHQSIEVPYESFYFYLYNLELYYEVTNKHTKCQVKLQFMQFDQCQPYNLPNPVVMTPYRYKQFTLEDEKHKPKYIFNSFVVIDNSFVKNLFVDLITVEMNNLVVKVSTQLLKVFLEIWKEFQEAQNNDEQYLLMKKTNTWNAIEPPKEGNKTFVKAIKIAPFTVDISAEIKLDELDADSVMFFGTILNALGVVITKIEGAPIYLEGIIIENCVDTLQGLNTKLIEHYKNTVLKQLFKVFGSLNILGNPVGLFRNISTGFKDLKDKPSEGFVQGPLEFGKGLAEGAGSLIAHSVGGALNSVEKFTGTVASGLAVLTFDKQFEERRERERMKKPKHVLEGIQKGGKAVFHGFKDGITGLFTQPYENAKKEGVLGFFKGTAKGLTGVVVKPVTGVIDFASKTTEGLKNTALYLEDKPNEARVREPRVFYTECSMIKDYDPLDSRLYGIIRSIRYEEKYGFENMFFINSYVIDEEHFLVLLKQDIIMIEKNKIQWAVPIESSEVKKENNGARVEAKERRQWFSHVLFCFSSQRVNEHVRFADEGGLMNFLEEAKNLKKNMKQQRQRDKYHDEDDA